MCSRCQTHEFPPIKSLRTLDVDEPTCIRPVDRDNPVQMDEVHVQAGGKKRGELVRRCAQRGELVAQCACLYMLFIPALLVAKGVHQTTHNASEDISQYSAPT